MPQRAKHIAVLLFLIFAFPIIFQPLHVVVHHGVAAVHHHSHEACHHSHEGIALLQDDTSCPICDYHFSINDLPQLSYFSAPSFFASSVLACFQVRASLQSYFSLQSPRAPPAIV